MQMGWGNLGSTTQTHLSEVLCFIQWFYENEKLRFAEHYELNMKYNDLKSVYGNVRETFNMDLTKEIKRLVRDCQEVMNGICSGKFLYKQKLT